MDTSTKLIAATTTLSLVLHVVVAMVLLLPGEIVPPLKGVGSGLEIHLISSLEVADNQETDEQVRERVVDQIAAIPEKVSHNVLSAQNNQSVILVPDTLQEEKIDKSYVMESIQLDGQNNALQFNQATNASQQQHSIVELLHSRISEMKEYPYIARRQRREGVATVAFELYPDGKIKNTHLVNSSRTQSLDRAALLAVQGIEPFYMAQDYLKQSEKFQVEVAFNLL